MSQMRAVLRDQRGFTLTELLVVATVLGMILAGVVLIQQRGQEAYLFGSHRVEVQQNNRAALELMVRELRSAESITTLGSDKDLTFEVCQNPYPNPTTPCLPADVVPVRYQLSGTTLNRTFNGTATPLIGGVQTLAMAYCQAGSTPAPPSTSPCFKISRAVATAPSQVALIVIQLTTGTEDSASTGSPANQRATMESMVRLRNVP
jgi:prepilin-type N-terminal cleavage/methylation domain-containing protein